MARYTKPVTLGKYEVLRFPNLNLPDPMKVKVTRILSGESHGRVVEFKYNGPLFTIKEYAVEREFQRRILTEIE